MEPNNKARNAEYREMMREVHEARALEREANANRVRKPRAKVSAKWTEAQKDAVFLNYHPHTPRGKTLARTSAGEMKRRAKQAARRAEKQNVV